MPVKLGHADDDLTQPVVPSIYAAQLVQLCARWNISPRQLLQEAGIAQGTLDDPEARITARALGDLVLRALALTAEPGLGFYYGLQLKLSSHGVVGLAAMASATLRDAILVAERYLALRAPYLQLLASNQGDQVEVELRSTLEHADPRLRVFITEALFTALIQIAGMLLGHSITGVVELSYPEPAHFPGFAHLWPGPARFGRPRNRLVFAAGLLTESLQMADEVAARRALSECERELSKLGEASTLLASVRRQLAARSAGFPSLTELAHERHVSVRTLKRRLSEQGTSYRQLLDELRRDRALMLLERADQTVEEIAESLGYSDPANFNRAFRRWLGVAPSLWRAQQGAKS